jgi:hypothetical protein
LFILLGPFLGVVAAWLWAQAADNPEESPPVRPNLFGWARHLLLCVPAVEMKRYQEPL